MVVVVMISLALNNKGDTSGRGRRVVLQLLVVLCVQSCSTVSEKMNRNAHVKTATELCLFVIAFITRYISMIDRVHTIYYIEVRTSQESYRY